MRKLFLNRQWIVRAGSAAAAAYGFPYPVECLLKCADGGQAAAHVDWDAELRALVDG